MASSEEVIRLLTSIDLRRCADLVRAEYPAPPVRQASHA